MVKVQIVENIIDTFMHSIVEIALVHVSCLYLSVSG